MWWCTTFWNVGNFKNGLRDGLWVFYNEDTTKKNYEGHYKEDKKDSEWIYWYPNGEVWKKGSYLNNLKHGLWNYYTEQKQLVISGTFKNGKEEGEWKTWYDTGKKKILEIM